MKLSFLRTHKSITSFPEINLPDFVVLTGVNGAGKSHLLEAIENGSMQIDDVIVNNQTRPIRRLAMERSALFESDVCLLPGSFPSMGFNIRKQAAFSGNNALRSIAREQK